MNWLFDCVVCIALRAVDIRNGMAHGTCDSGLRRGMFEHVELRIVEGSTEERHRVMASGAEPRALHVAIALHAEFSRFRHAGKVGRIVKGTEMMRALRPVVVSVLVALHAIVIHGQYFGGNEIACGCPGE